MDLSQFDGTYLIVAIALILLLVAQNWLINRRRAWMGILLPSAYASSLVYLGLVGRIGSPAEFVFAAAGLFCLIAWWASARGARQTSDEDELIVITPWTAADSSVSFPPPGTGVRRHIHLRAG